MQKKLLKQVIKILGPCNIEERGRWVPLSEDYINNKFDLDLDFGKVGEKYIEQVFVFSHYHLWIMEVFLY